MRRFRKLVRMLGHATIASPWRCKKCGARGTGPVSGITCPKGGSHDWEYIG